MYRLAMRLSPSITTNLELPAGAESAEHGSPMWASQFSGCQAAPVRLRVHWPSPSWATVAQERIPTK